GAAPRSRSSSTALRMVAEVARLNRRTKLLIGLLVVVLAGFGALQWQSARDARDVARLQARADSMEVQAQGLLTRLQAELASVRDALRQSQVEVARLRTDLAAAGTSGNAGAVARLRAALDAAETRQRGLAGAVVMDYRTISLKNQDAVELLVVQFSDSEIFSGTAFAADSQGTLVTNRHILVGEDGTRQPRRIAIKFSGSRQSGVAGQDHLRRSGEPNRRISNPARHHAIKSPEKAGERPNAREGAPPSPFPGLLLASYRTLPRTHLAAARCMRGCPCQHKRIGVAPGICDASRGWPNSTTSCAPGTRRRRAARDRAPRSARPFHERGSAYTRIMRCRLPVARCPRATPASRSVAWNTSRGPPG